jgi:hypothetical protein
MNSIPAGDVLRGIDTRLLLAAATVFAATAAVFATAPRFGEPFATPVHGVLHGVTMALWWEGLVVGLLLVAALDAARGEGPVRAWLVAFAVGAGVGVNFGGLAITGTLPGLGTRVLWAVVVGVALAAVVGTTGHLIGRGGARLRRSA